MPPGVGGEAIRQTRIGASLIDFTRYLNQMSGIRPVWVMLGFAPPAELYLMGVTQTENRQDALNECAKRFTAMGEGIITAYTVREISSTSFPRELTQWLWFCGASETVDYEAAVDYVYSRFSACWDSSLKELMAK